MEDRSLDEFVDADKRAGDAAGSDRTTDDEPADPPGDGASDAGTGAEAPDPAVSTAAWDPSGGTCVACETTVQRRWRGEAGLVCPDCKEW